MPYFLYFTKSRKKVAAGRRKDLSLFVRSRHFCVLIRGLQNLESPLEKVLILFVRSRHCGELNRGLQNLGTPGKGVRVVTFCGVQKVTQKVTSRSLCRNHRGFANLESAHPNINFALTKLNSFGKLRGSVRSHGNTGTHKKRKHHARIEPTVFKTADKHNARHGSGRRNRIVANAGTRLAR